MFVMATQTGDSKYQLVLPLFELAVLKDVPLAYMFDRERIPKCPQVAVKQNQLVSANE